MQETVEQINPAVPIPVETEPAPAVAEVAPGPVEPTTVPEAEVAQPNVPNVAESPEATPQAVDAVSEPEAVVPAPEAAVEETPAEPSAAIAPSDEDMDAMMERLLGPEVPEGAEAAGDVEQASVPDADFGVPRVDDSQLLQDAKFDPSTGVLTLRVAHPDKDVEGGFRYVEKRITGVSNADATADMYLHSARNAFQTSRLIAEKDHYRKQVDDAKRPQPAVEPPPEVLGADFEGLLEPAGRTPTPEAVGEMPTVPKERDSLVVSRAKLLEPQLRGHLSQIVTQDPSHIDMLKEQVRVDEFQTLRAMDDEAERESWIDAKARSEMKRADGYASKYPDTPQGQAHLTQLAEYHANEQRQEVHKAVAEAEVRVGPAVRSVADFYDRCIDQGRKPESANERRLLAVWGDMPAMAAYVLHFPDVKEVRETAGKKARENETKRIRDKFAKERAGRRREILRGPGASAASSSVEAAAAAAQATRTNVPVTPVQPSEAAETFLATSEPSPVSIFDAGMGRSGPKQ